MNTEQATVIEIDPNTLDWTKMKVQTCDSDDVIITELPARTITNSRGFMADYIPENMLRDVNGDWFAYREYFRTLIYIEGYGLFNSPELELVVRNISLIGERKAQPIITEYRYQYTIELHMYRRDTKAHIQAIVEYPQFHMLYSLLGKATAISADGRSHVTYSGTTHRVFYEFNCIEIDEAHTPGVTYISEWKPKDSVAEYPSSIKCSKAQKPFVAGMIFTSARYPHMNLIIRASTYKPNESSIKWQLISYKNYSASKKSRKVSGEMSHQVLHRMIKNNELTLTDIEPDTMVHDDADEFYSVISSNAERHYQSRWKKEINEVALKENKAKLDSLLDDILNGKGTNSTRMSCLATLGTICDLSAKAKT